MEGIRDQGPGNRDQGVRGFRDLVVWKRGIALVTMVYEDVALLPSSERFAMADQMRRSAVSVPSNIAEGHAKSTKDFQRFLSIALGSLAELETLYEISRQVGYISEQRCGYMFEYIEELRRMLCSLRRKLAPGP